MTTDPSTLESLDQALKWVGDRLARDAALGGRAPKDAA
jgi:hypothetical protein